MLNQSYFTKSQLFSMTCDDGNAICHLDHYACLIVYQLVCISDQHLRVEGWPDGLHRHAGRLQQGDHLVGRHGDVVIGQDGGTVDTRQLLGGDVAITCHDVCKF